MRSSVQIVTPPTTEPVTLAQVRAHFRMDSEIDDTELTLYATSARMMAEAYLGRYLLTTGALWTAAPDVSPAAYYSNIRWYGPIEFPRGGVQAVSSVVLTDILGTATTLPAGAYLLDLGVNPARLRFIYSGGLIPTDQPIEHFQISFTAGYGTASDVPLPIINAILVIALYLYERRGDDGGELPKAAEWLLDPFRLIYFGG